MAKVKSKTKEPETGPVGKTKVIGCSCKHEGQDRIYGEKRRLHNRYSKPEPGGWRCTVCDTKH